MGTYIYTMRKRKQVFDAAGERAEANLYSYAYRASNSMFSRPSDVRREASIDAAGDRAFRAYTDGYVIVGDLDHGIKGLHGAVVYDQVKHGRYVDCNDFPGRALGFIEVRDKRCFLVYTRPWYKHSGSDEREYREVVKDGKVVTEGRFINDHTPIIRGETVNEKGERIV